MTAERTVFRKMYEHIKPNSKLFFVTRHVARSGMLRRLSVFQALPYDGDVTMVDITHTIALITGFNVKEGQLVVRGAGFCAANEVTSAASRALFGHELMLRFSYV